MVLRELEREHNFVLAIYQQSKTREHKHRYDGDSRIFRADMILAL